MTAFIYKQIKNQSTVAERLKSKRSSLGYPLEKISKILNIDTKYLTALENGDYYQLPGEIYIKQWLKKYGQLLQLNSQELIKDYQQETKQQLNFSDYQHRGFGFKKKSFNLSPKFTRNFFISLIVLVLIFYLGWQVKKIIEPPPLRILEPANNSTTAVTKISIKGKTQPEVSVWINNQQVLINNDGLFEQEVELIPGLNIFQISAKKKNSQKNNLTLSIIKINNPPTGNDQTINNLNNLGLSYKITGSIYQLI